MPFSNFTAKEIAARLQTGTLSWEEMALLRQDGRKAVQGALKRWERQQEEVRRQWRLHRYEREFRSQGLWNIAGIDEAGRGPLAGPVVVAAVILPADHILPGLDDSKKLSSAKREALYHAIQEQALAVSAVVISSQRVDELNIYQATVAGMIEALQGLTVQADAVLTDAVPLPGITIPQQALIKGDSLSASIAAASIVAKVERDAIMSRLEETYPGYGFGAHKGYGTAEHLAALYRLGPTPEHRRSFEPIKSME